MADEFLLVQVQERERANPRPNGTREIASAESLEEIADVVAEKTGRGKELDPRLPMDNFVGGDRDGRR